MLLRKALLICLLPIAFAQLSTTSQHTCQISATASCSANILPSAQVNGKPPISGFQRIAPSAQKFALDLFTKFADSYVATNNNLNFMISPFSIWALLLLITEAADGETLKQLRDGLYITDEPETIRSAFGDIFKYLTLKTATVEVASFQGLFLDSYEPLINRNYTFLVEKCYNAFIQQLPLNGTQAADHINGIIDQKTGGLIKNVLQSKDLEGAILFMTSTIYFMGQWKKPFDKAFTRTAPFHNEQGEVVGNVEMMTQFSNFLYVNINELEGHVLELPYGHEDRLSMLIILPRKGIRIDKTTYNLQKIGIAEIFKRLAAASEGFEEEEVEVFLPKFTTITSSLINEVLEKLNIKNIFSPNDANLCKMSKNSFVTDVVHSSVIVVNEEGTKATAVTTATLANKATPPKFNLNRPFIYLIVEKRANLILFAGQFKNPN